MKILGLLFVVASMFLAGCSAGDLRAFDDAMNNNYYPDQSDVKYVGDVRWETGVRNGSGYEKIKNTGDKYCKVRVTLEDGSKRTYRLDPHESLGTHHMSIYNQSKHMQTLCNVSSRVFSEPFK